MNKSTNEHDYCYNCKENINQEIASHASGFTQWQNLSPAAKHEFGLRHINKHGEIT